MSNDLTERAKKHIIETLVAETLLADVDYMSISESIEDEFPGLEVSDEGLGLIMEGVREELSFAYDLWVNEQ